MSKKTRKQLRTYEQLATSNGYTDPLTYLFGRLKSAQIRGDHRAAEQLATMLLPYGHGRKAPVDNEGETVKPGIFTLE